jgi:hypothetical protein
MTKPVNIRVELSSDGITQSVILADTADEQAAGTLLLAKLAPELRSLDSAIRRQRRGELPRRVEAAV